MEYITAKHSMPCGDLLSLLPGMRQVYRSTGKKWVIYQRVNLEYGEMSGAYVGASYSIKNEANAPVTMNRMVFEALMPLLVFQDYIEDFKIWDGEKVDIDFDLLRQWDSTMPYGSINRWPFYLWPDMACNLSESWFVYPKLEKSDISGKILINRTERYTNMLISYNFLKKYKDNVWFLGLPNEYEIFCKHHGINIPHYITKDYLHIAPALASCKLYIGNASSIFQVAEGLKVNRILEVFKPLPNVIGSGKGFYDFLHQNALEYYCDKLFNE